MKQIDELEKRLFSAAVIAGILEITLKFITGWHFLGYLGLGMILYGLAHYVLWKYWRTKPWY